MFFEMDLRLHDKTGKEKGKVSAIEIEPGHWIVEAKDADEAAEKLQGVLDMMSEEGFSTMSDPDETHVELFEKWRDGRFSEESRLKHAKFDKEWREQHLRDEIREDIRKHTERVNARKLTAN